MPYFVFGLNHETAPVAVREAFEFSNETLSRLYAGATVPRRTEWLVLSTCNRTEVYVHGTHKDVAVVRRAIDAECGPWPEPMAFEYEGEAAVTHIIEVVAGLRSQSLGDSQILAQSKEAYRLAVAAENLGPWMHRLMHGAFAAAKRTITETGLGLYGASVARSAIQTALSRLEIETRSQNSLTALVLGGGNMGSLLIRELAMRSPLQCYVANRTRSRARQLAAKFEFEDIDWENRIRCASEVDIVFVTTGASEFVLTEKLLSQTSPQTQTLIVDIAVPRNVEPSISNLPGYDVLNIDALLGPRGSGNSTLSKDLAEARAICSNAVQGIMDWANRHLAVQPAIQTLHETFEAVRRREVERNLHRVAESEHENVERLTRSIMQKLLAIPIVHLKTMAAGDADFASRIAFLNEVFDRSHCEDLNGRQVDEHDVVS